MQDNSNLSFIEFDELYISAKQKEYHEAEVTALLLMFRETSEKSANLEIK